MKFIFNFHSLILIILFSNIIYIHNINTQSSTQLKENKISKKIKGNKLLQKGKIIDYFFLKKGKNKINSKIKDKNNIIQDINTELTKDFNNYQTINSKNSKLFPKTKKIEINSFNSDYLKDEFNIYSNTYEDNIIYEDYRKNDFLIKYNNIKNNQEEDAYKDISTNSPNSKINKNDNKIENNNNVVNDFKKFMPNKRNDIFGDNNNYNYYTTDDDEFDMHNMRNGKMFHDNFNSMRYNPRSSGSSFKNNLPTYSSNQNHKSKLNEYMNSIYQIMMVLCFVGFIYKLFFGNKQNDKYALAWYEANKDYFKERYEIFGLVEDEENGSFKKDENMKECKMIKENPNNYKLICGNYRYIKYIAVSLQFHKKYDMSLFVASMFVTLRDKIIFQVAFNSVDPCRWVFCIGKKNQCISIKENYEDLNYFCDIYQPKFMDEYMCLISEDYDVFEELFKNNSSLLQYYRNVEPFIETIYYSDIINLLTEENNIYFSFEIDLTASEQNNRIFLEITHFVNLFVDGLAQIKYTKEFKEKVSKNRILYQENKIYDSRKKEIEEEEKQKFIEKWKIKQKMKGKSGFERKKLEKKLKKYH